MEAIKEFWPGFSLVFPKGLQPTATQVEDALACCSPWGREESETTERLNRIAVSCGGQVVVTGNVHKSAAVLHTQLWLLGQPEP